MVSLNAAFFYLHSVGPVGVAAIWLASARWVNVDARSRLRNPSGIRAATLTAATLPFVGAALWACVRPNETLAQRRERRLVRLVLEEELLVAPRDEDLGHVRQHDRSRQGRDPLAQLPFEVPPVGRRRVRDEALGEEAVDDAGVIQQLLVRQPCLLDPAEEAG